MDLDQLRDILELVREHEISEFEFEQDGVRLRVRKDGVAAPVAPLQAAAAAPPVVHGAAPVPLPAPSAPAAAAEAEIELAIVKSPIVGTFYRSPEPGAASFVEVGSLVRKGQVLCIIEAMKLMNEITADADGEVVKCYVENGQAVQYGERLFAIKPPHV